MTDWTVENGVQIYECNKITRILQGLFKGILYRSNLK